MTTRPQPEEPFAPIDSALWRQIVAFLFSKKTGRVTLHVERGTVRMVESTEFVRSKPENLMDRKSDDRVESP